LGDGWKKYRPQHQTSAQGDETSISFLQWLASYLSQNWLTLIEQYVFLSNV
jgi:hypothetical protein